MKVRSQLHAPAALPPGKEPQYPLDRRLGGRQSRSGHCGVHKTLLLLQGIEPLLFSPWPFAIRTELSRLPHHDDDDDDYDYDDYYYYFISARHRFYTGPGKACGIQPQRSAPLPRITFLA
jgi:hypothetical protein